MIMSSSHLLMNLVIRRLSAFARLTLLVELSGSLCRQYLLAGTMRIKSNIGFWKPVSGLVILEPES